MLKLKYSTKDEIILSDDSRDYYVNLDKGVIRMSLSLKEIICHVTFDEMYVKEIPLSELIKKYPRVFGTLFKDSIFDIREDLYTPSGLEYWYKEIAHSYYNAKWK